MDLSIVNNDYYLSGMAALVGDVDSKTDKSHVSYISHTCLCRTANGYVT